MLIENPSDFAGEVLRTKDGQLWDKRSLYVKAIELDLQGCSGGMGRMGLVFGNSPTCPAGKDPSYAFAYNNLAVLMAPQVLSGEGGLVMLSY